MKPGSGVTIPLTNKYWITSDNLNWRLSTRHVVDGLPVWKHEGYFPTVKGVLKEAFDRSLRTSGAESFKELDDYARKLLTKFATIFDEKFANEPITDKNTSHTQVEDDPT